MYPCTPGHEIDHQRRPTHLKPGSTILASTCEQAYDPAANLYDLRPDQGCYDELRKSLPDSLGLRALCQRCCTRPNLHPATIPGGATEHHWRNMAGTIRWAGRPASRTYLHLRSARDTGRLLPPTIFTEQVAAKVNLSRGMQHRRPQKRPIGTLTVSPLTRGRLTYEAETIKTSVLHRHIR